MKTRNLVILISSVAILALLLGGIYLYKSTPNARRTLSAMKTIHPLIKDVGSKQQAVDSGDIANCIGLSYAADCITQIDESKTIPLEELEGACLGARALNDGYATCIGVIAAHKETISLCERFDSEGGEAYPGSARIACFTEAADYGLTIPVDDIVALCESLQSGSTGRGLCFHRVATHTENIALCEGSGKLKDICLSTFDD